MNSRFGYCVSTDGICVIDCMMEILLPMRADASFAELTIGF